MPISESTLSRWSHHQAGTAFKQAHVPIREALDAYKGLSQFNYEIFLQGSYKSDTSVVNISYTRSIHRDECDPPDAPDNNQVVFAVDRGETRDLCRVPAVDPTTPAGCWKGRGGADLAANTGSNETTIVIRGDQYNPVLDWDAQTRVGMCTQLEDTTAH